MLYSSKRHEPLPTLIGPLLVFAFLGAVLTAAQAMLILVQGEAVCLNDGCEIVESLTRVPPLLFNLAGSLFFLTLFLCLRLGSRGSRIWLALARVLLLAGLAAEGVLVGFQYLIAEVFCSYCLVILGWIAALNVFMGLRQFLSGLVIFGSVLAAFFSLEFEKSSSGGAAADLQRGVYGTLQPSGGIERGLSFFFSSTCPHCEEVIATVDETFSCNLQLNPIDILPVSPLAGVTIRSEYQPQANISFLKSLGIQEIPVLLIAGDDELRLLQGKNTILGYLDEYCRDSGRQSGEQEELIGETSLVEPGYRLPVVSEEEGCAIDLDCEEVGTGTTSPGQ